MQRNGDITNHVKERMKRAYVCGDETSMGNRRKKVQRRLQKKDDAVRLFRCGSHVVRGKTFRLEGTNRM